MKNQSLIQTQDFCRTQKKTNKVHWSQVKWLTAAAISFILFGPFTNQAQSASSKQSAPGSKTNSNTKDEGSFGSTNAKTVNSKLTTIKTIPENSTQILLVPNDSPLSPLYQQALADSKINNEAVNAAFDFFLKNKDGLQTQGLCLGKDNTVNRKKIRNQDCLIIADYTKTKLEPRLHIFKFSENKIYNLLTAHGKGSNLKDKDLKPSKFSNTSGSLQTSLGFFLTDVSYSSQKDTFGPGPNNGIKLDGLSCTNNNARRRYIVMHTAKYVSDTVENEDSIGYSEGCITLAPSQKNLMLSCTDGALLYTHGEN